MKFYRGKTDDADRKALDLMEAVFLIEENKKEVENNLENSSPLPNSDKLDLAEKA